MYNVPSTARYLGYCEKGWPPVKISNRIPVTTGDAKLQKVASAKVIPAGIAQQCSFTATGRREILVQMDCECSVTC